MTVPRLQPFLFRVRRDDGGEPFAIFYASTEAIAKKYANAWAAARGFTVALVPNEVAS